MAETSYPFKNLVLKGGGIRGIAYLGTIKVLQEAGIIDKIERVAGSSAGAITALLLALNFDYDEFKDIADSLDFKEVPGIPSFWARGIEGGDELDDVTSRGIGGWLTGLGTTISEVKFLFNRMGMHTSDYLYEWIGDQVAKKLGSSSATFEDLKNDENCKDLYITVTNISNGSSHICCAENTPELEIAEAVRTSMSIPIYFEAIEFENKYLAGYFGDGGVMNNYPINLFDHGLDPNPETLGLFLYSKVKKQSFPENYKLKNFVGATINALLSAQDWAVARQKEDLARSVQIWDCGISATNFDIVKGDENYKKLYDAGTEGANDFLAAFNGNKDDLQKCKFIPANIGMF